jgi:hypothetical protein
MNPPERAVVLCVDEKSQIQALDRTQPGLPIKKGRAGTMTHDYKRNGTTTLFAALEVKTGKVIGECLPRHRYERNPGLRRVINDHNIPFKSYDRFRKGDLDARQQVMTRLAEEVWNVARLDEEASAPTQ